MDKVKHIMSKLISNGFECFVVGGSLRNKLHNEIHNDKLDIKDIDIVSNASVEDVMKIFDQVELRGAHFGVAVVNIEDEQFEIAQYRKDEYPDGGSLRPTNTQKVDTLLEDIKRRDFTINSICENINGECVDYFNGISDIKNKLIRAIGNPLDRFKEDPNRIFRAIRFVSQLGYDIEKETIKGIKESLELIRIIPHDRVKDEMIKIMRGKYVEKAFQYMKNLEFYKYTFHNTILDKQVYAFPALLQSDISRIQFDKIKQTDLISIKYFLLYQFVQKEMAIEEFNNTRLYGQKIIDFVSIMIDNREIVYHQNENSFIYLLDSLPIKWKERKYVERILDNYHFVYGIDFNFESYLNMPLFLKEDKSLVEVIISKLEEHEKRWIKGIFEECRNTLIKGEKYDLDLIIDKRRDYNGK